MDRAPLTPGGWLLLRPVLLVAAMCGFVALTALAVFDDAQLLSPADEAVDRVARDWRHPDVLSVFRIVTELGGGPVVLPLGVLAAAVVARRSPTLAVAFLLALAARYVLEDVVKELVGRERPAGERLTPAGGFSFPSGHALGAVVAWGLVPAAVRTISNRVGHWRAAMVVWGIVVLGVAASRLYLGVHWLLDVTGSILLGLLILAAVDVAAHRSSR